MSLAGREILLGVGGGISAYKAAELLRRLQDLGLGVTVIPTQASLRFVGSATWEALSGRAVLENLWENVQQVPHIKAAREANLIVIAPTTADLLSRIAGGVANDLLTNVVLATTAPIVLIPAMHPEMWLNAATQENVEKLRDRGVLVIEPDEGRMTGDDIGVGRFPEVTRLLSEISKFVDLNSDLLGRRILVTAGGTREPIDPVRYIGNLSSGKQGYAIARAARNRGAIVTLISANSSLAEEQGVRTIHVTSTEEMSSALNVEFAKNDVLFMAAAVADAKPLLVSDAKIKKENFLSIELVQNPDLLAGITKARRGDQVIVAFAAETGDIDIAGAQEKLKRKGADLLFLNDVTDGAIFGSEETQGSLLDSDGEILSIEKQGKDTLADILLDRALIKLG
jgi:phosphopantothenoylcysteine decarboxylase / phosphopantothenate---cysteine ligase